MPMNFPLNSRKCLIGIRIDPGLHPSRLNRLLGPGIGSPKPDVTDVNISVDWFLPFPSSLLTLLSSFTLPPSLLTAQSWHLSF
jgi:hypothetical protein